MGHAARRWGVPVVYVNAVGGNDGILFDGDINLEDCTVECPRHGSLFDLRTGRPTNLPAYVPVDTFPVVVEGDMIRLEVD